MSSAICQNFVQNAWKKELCSNCFKSRNEHQERNILRPLPLLSRRIESIIKNGKKTKLNNRSVRFPNQIAEVIGYGGEDWFSEEEDDFSKCAEADAEPDDSSDESDVLELRKITKANTDFNATTSTLDDTETKKSYATLLLGKPLVDSDGKKKTLLVSVKPFGEETTIAPPRKISKNPTPISISKNNKERVTEKNTNVILTSYTRNDEIERTEEKSLLEEITETLENTRKDAVQIMSRKRIEQDTKLKTNDAIIVKSEKKILLSRSPAVKKEHVPLYQKSNSKVDLINSKNTKLNKENEMKTELLDNNEREKNVDEDIIKNDTATKTENQQWTPTESEKDSSESSLSPVSSSSDLEQDAAPKETREQAGEPDGRADPDGGSEPPALPLTPPPVLDVTPPSAAVFPLVTKPKIPSKPVNTVLIRKPVKVRHVMENRPQILTTFTTTEVPGKDVTKTDNSEVGNQITNKRKAPRPPEDGGGMGVGLFSRKITNPINAESPVVREKEKRERSKLPNIVAVSPKIDCEIVPEPAPRKSLSTSNDSLASVDDKRRDKSKGKFSLKKFLRMGSSKDLTKLPLDSCKFDEIDLAAPTPKPRLVIVHPLELNGDKVEVVVKPKVTNDYENVSIKSFGKPPPPPRHIEENVQKPPVTPPPKSVDVLNIQKQVSRNNSLNKKTEETVYANIGEVRSSIVPNKPVRTASMREREAQQQQQQKQATTYNACTYNLDGTRSSSPDSDSSREKNSPKMNKLSPKKRSESNIDISCDYFKYGNIPRSVSLTYCGSETESEIYSPYNFYGSETEITEDDHEWVQNGKTHKLRSRKGRSIVHKNLEDNYGAVIVANHEALAQVLENIQQSVHVPQSLRSLKTTTNLRWGDFSIKTTNPVILGKRTFHQALWGVHHVTLSINRGQAPSCTLSLGTFNLNPVTEFSDLVPVIYLGESDADETKLVQATITVLPWMQVNTIQSFASLSRARSPIEDNSKDAIFVLLQLVNALKNLQAQGIEELPISLNSFILCKDMERDSYQKLFVLQGLSEEITQKNEKLATLCHCASTALQSLQQVVAAKLNSLLQSLLNNERATSLSQVKSVLEFSLWGPSDVALGSSVRERELALQRWLDLQRATVLHGLVCTRVQLTVYEEYHLLFLVRSNARMMCDASLLIESSNAKNVTK